LLGKYRIDSVIGRGGMGLVVKAWHLGLHEPVAIKMLRDDIVVADETIARFIREAQAAVRLKSEHIARITDVGTFDDGKPYMVMELLEGQDIGQLLTERGQLQPSLAIDLVIQACEALAEAHSLGIVHRDIKPTNLFLTSHPDGSLLLKVLDFGISKAPDGAELSLTQTWSMLGSPAYMSPEQMRSARHVDARTDVWSLGAVLYEAVEGHLPFPAESFSEMCVMVAVDPPAPLVAAPPPLAAIVMRCLTKNPDERYANVAELGRDLARLAREPDKAKLLVDRMYRVLGRGGHRTPAAGIPVTGDPGTSTGTGTRREREVLSPQLVADAHAAAMPPQAVAYAHAASPPQAVAYAHASPPQAVAYAHAASPIAAGSTVGIAPPPAGSGAGLALPPYAGYPVATGTPRPGAPIAYARVGPDAGASSPRAAAVEALTTTHVMSRRAALPRHGPRWTIAATAAFVALAAATAIIVVATRAARAPASPNLAPSHDGPDVVRVKMTPVAPSEPPPPASTPPAARSASPAARSAPPPPRAQ
jgi:serine/threonine-protein kinase